MRYTALFLSATALVTVLTAFDAAGAEVYRWKDASGKYHFSDKRPVEGAADKVVVEAPAQKSNPELEQFRKQTRENLAALDAERAKAEEQARVRKVIAARQERNCTQLRNAMRTEEQVAVLYSFDAQGEMQHLTDAERDTYKKDLQSQWQRYCSGH